MNAPVRFAYVTTSMDNLDAARKLAADRGFAVDMLPPDAPAPRPGAFDGLMVDFAGKHPLARKLFLNKLVRLAKDVPVVVYDRGANYAETAALRAAGIAWFPTLRERAFDALLTHPLAAKVAAARAAAATASAETLPDVELPALAEKPVVVE